MGVISEDERERREERAAIIEYCGLLPRREAERLAANPPAIHRQSTLALPEVTLAAAS